ncbi:two-component sensor histidine kinase [Streptomyces vinaceus]|uniref:histidine kinase n=1 Tax=Streptomyces vinaceus TaxID=1960 RepID=A0A5J6J8T9_STRVI|nr:two-component sensor histidine kinase [Streptomyces vinaceus]GHE57957.1 two-component sensor histidine kinase [Streptomyces vinaceus]
MPARETDRPVGPARWTSLDRGGRSARSQLLLVVAVAAAGIVTIRPMGLGGRGLAVVLLFVVNCAVLALRLVPESALSDRLLTVWLAFGVLAAAGLIGAGRSGTVYVFAFLLTAFAGSRLDTRAALALAVSCSLLCGGVLYVQAEPGRYATTVLGLATGAAVLGGMAGRSRAQATRAAIAAAESAEKAARAEARTAVLAERTRIARDVHDVLAHSLAGLNMQLELVDALIDTGDLDRIREANGRAHSLVKESLRQAQWTVHALREDHLPLRESLTAMLESSGHHGALTVVGDVRELSAQSTRCLLRIAQEALTNATRHAPGGEVAITVTFTEEATVLNVRNRSATSPVTAAAGSGMGLIGMRERIALIGGALTTGPVTTGPDSGGWQVEAVIPR